MSGFATSNQVGVALLQAGLSPFVLDTDMYQIVWGGENYTVFADCPPMVYIEKTVPLDLFEYKHETWILYFAMDLVNLRRTPVVVYRGNHDDTLSFRICLPADVFDSFEENEDSVFMQIEEAIDTLGQACEIAVRSNN